MISGASAGALTGAVGVISLSKGMQSYDPNGDIYARYALKQLYDAWVADIDMASPAGVNDLLSLEDLSEKAAAVEGSGRTKASSRRTSRFSRY